MTYRIRRSLVSDTEVLGRVAAQAWNESYATIMPEAALAKSATVERRTEIRREFFAKTTPDWAHFLVETEKGNIVGFCDCGPVDKSESKEFGSSEILAIYLLRPAQGQGLGKRMFRMMLKHLAERGFDSAVLDVFMKNEKAIRFYEGMGGKKKAEMTREFAGTSLPLAVYMWSDLKKYASASRVL